MIEVICEYCGATFTAKRSTAKFCKPSHRSQYHQLPTDVHNAGVAALQALSRLETLLDIHPHLLLDVEQSHKAIRRYLDVFGVDL